MITTSEGQPFNCVYQWPFNDIFQADNGEPIRDIQLGCIPLYICKILSKVIGYVCMIISCILNYI